MPIDVPINNPILRASAPYLSIISIGSIPFPNDLLNFLPDLSLTNPWIITSLNGSDDRAEINSYVDNLLLSKDSLFLRKEMVRVAPDIELRQEIEIGGEAVDVDIPLTVEFFWPKTN